MPASAPPRPAEPVDFEWLAAEWLIEQAEAVDHDRHDRLDQFSDSALADQLVTAWAERIGKVDFEQVVAAFTKLRAD
jgi:hypothetical protein